MKQLIADFRNPRISPFSKIIAALWLLMIAICVSILVFGSAAAIFTFSPLVCGKCLLSVATFAMVGFVFAKMLMWFAKQRCV
jgi:hypothetical protein